MQEVVITAVGPDRPGIVDELTGELYKVQANVADSRMVNLKGQFAIILLAQCPKDQTDQLQAKLDVAGPKLGLMISLAGEAGGLDDRRGQPFQVRVHAMDQPGIVHRITHVLHQHQVNIEELETRLQPGSYTGTPLFSLDMRVTIPADVQVKAVRAELVALGDALNCDVSIESI